MWTDTGFNQEQKSLCKGTAHYSGDQAPCQSFMCPSRITYNETVIYYKKWIASLYLFQITFLYNLHNLTNSLPILHQCFFGKGCKFIH